jgi:hypothetical protein
MLGQNVLKASQYEFKYCTHIQIVKNRLLGIPAIIVCLEIMRLLLFESLYCLTGHLTPRIGVDAPLVCCLNQGI